MRNYLYLFFIFALTACNKEKIIISGKISNAEKSKLYLEQVDVYESLAVDSLTLSKNGRFRFVIESSIPGFYQLKLAGDKNIVLFPGPGQHISIQADANNIITSLKTAGSKDTELATQLIRFCNNTRSRLDSIDILYSKAATEEIRTSLVKEYQAVLDKQRKYSTSFILENYNSLASIYALYQQYMPDAYVFYKTTDMQFFRIVSDSLIKYHPESQHVKALKAYTDKMISNYNAQLVLQKAGTNDYSLPDIALPDFAGDITTLRSLKGRYVLLTFWSSTSPSSVSQNLKLKKIYNKYRRNGFEIYQVSFDNSADNWKKAVVYDELPWISVIDASYPNSVVAGNYNVTSVPINYLIDKDQVNILAKNLTPGQLEEKLADIF
jgi:peroxiredoxin